MSLSSEQSGGSTHKSGYEWNPLPHSTKFWHMVTERWYVIVTPHDTEFSNLNEVVFRDGPDKYQPYEQYKALPIISVPPVRRPKLDSSEKNYSFTQEKDEMKEQLRTALRIAVWAKHYKICIGSFGLGPGFKNPPEEVAIMWKELLLDDSEFFGFFSDVVFAFESPEGPASSTTSSSSSSKPSSKSSKSSSSRSSSSRSSSSKHNFREDLDVFRRVFNPAALYGATRLL